MSKEEKGGSYNKHNDKYNEKYKENIIKKIENIYQSKKGIIDYYYKNKFTNVMNENIGDFIKSKKNNGLKNIIIEHNKNIDISMDKPNNKSNNKCYKNYNLFSASLEEIMKMEDDLGQFDINISKETWLIGKKAQLKNKYSSYCAVLVNEDGDVYKAKADSDDTKGKTDEEKETCLTCYDTLGKRYIKLLCSHKYHYECIFNSYKYAKRPSCRACPYCRSNGGWLPLPEGDTPVKNIHKSYKKSKPRKVLFRSKRCKGVLKSGMKKGSQCSHRGKNNGYCGKHQKQSPLTI